MDSFASLAIALFNLSRHCETFTHSGFQSTTFLVRNQVILTGLSAEWVSRTFLKNKTLYQSADKQSLKRAFHIRNHFLAFLPPFLFYQFRHRISNWLSPRKSRKYRGGPNMVAIIFITGTNNACNPSHPSDLISLQSLLQWGPNMDEI